MGPKSPSPVKFGLGSRLADFDQHFRGVYLDWANFGCLDQVASLEIALPSFAGASTTPQNPRGIAVLHGLHFLLERPPAGGGVQNMQNGPYTEA